MTIDLTALLAQAESAVARQTKAQREQAARQETADLSDDRRRAQRVVRETLEIETVQTDWTRLELAPDLAAYASRTVWHETDEDDLRLAFRHRGITAGGDVLTLVALADETGEWIPAATTIGGLVDLPSVVEDARRQADRWDEAVAEADGDPDLAAIQAAGRPAVTISGASHAEVLFHALRGFLAEDL